MLLYKLTSYPLMNPWGPGGPGGPGSPCRPGTPSRPGSPLPPCHQSQYYQDADMNKHCLLIRFFIILLLYLTKNRHLNITKIRKMPWKDF